MNSSNNSSGDSNEVVQIDYYKLTFVEKDQLISMMNQAAESLNKVQLDQSKNSNEFVLKFLDNDDVCDLFIYLSRLQVFSKEFADALKTNLDLLATAKKLKYFTNLSLG